MRGGWPGWPRGFSVVNGVPNGLTFTGYTALVVANFFSIVTGQPATGLDISQAFVHECITYNSRNDPFNTSLGDVIAKALEAGKTVLLTGTADLMGNSYQECVSNLRTIEAAGLPIRIVNLTQPPAEKPGWTNPKLNLRPSLN